MEARIDNYHTWIQSSDQVTLVKDIEKTLQASGFTILNFIEHHFEPQGYTALWLLAESHCALHTFPEEGKAYLEISSCNAQMFVSFLKLINKHYDRI